MPYITITVPSGTVIGRTVDAKIGAAPGRGDVAHAGDMRMIFAANANKRPA